MKFRSKYLKPWPRWTSQRRGDTGYQPQCSTSHLTLTPSSPSYQEINRHQFRLITKNGTPKDTGDSWYPPSLLSELGWSWKLALQLSFTLITNPSSQPFHLTLGRRWSPSISPTLISGLRYWPSFASPTSDSSQSSNFHPSPHSRWSPSH